MAAVLTGQLLSYLAHWFMLNHSSNGKVGLSVASWNQDLSLEQNLQQCFFFFLLILTNVGPEVTARAFIFTNQSEQLHF